MNSFARLNEISEHGFGITDHGFGDDGQAGFFRRARNAPENFFAEISLNTQTKRKFTR
jgi:hypothetical protein